MDTNDKDNASDETPPPTPIERIGKDEEEARAHDIRLRFALELVIGISNGPGDAICALSEAIIVLCVGMQVPLNGIAAYFAAVVEAHDKMPEDEKMNDFASAQQTIEYCMKRAAAHRLKRDAVRSRTTTPANETKEP